MNAHVLTRTLAAMLLIALTAAGASATVVGGPGYFANVALTTQDGKVVRFYDDLLKGKNVVINLIYTHCTASCPLETAKLSQVQRILGDRVGKDIFFYSISIDPTNDKPETLKAYAEKFHVKPGWLFLTGKKQDIDVISRQLGLASLTDSSNADGHLPALMIGKEASNQWMRNSAVDNAQFLATTILHFVDGYKSTKPASYATYAAPEPGKGEYLFQSRCAACHTIGKGDRVGPDLANVTKSRDAAWLARYVAAPDRVLASGDPIAKKLFAKYDSVRMPNLSLSAEEVHAILGYVDRQSDAASNGVTTFSLVAVDGSAPFVGCHGSVTSGTIAIGATGYVATFNAADPYRDKGHVMVSGNSYMFHSPATNAMFTGTLNRGTLTVNGYPYCGATHTLVYQ